MAIEVQADPKHLSVWSGPSAQFGRMDYRTDQYRLGDMLNDKFFGLCWSHLKAGDYITITDCEDQLMTIRVDSIDRQTRKVFISRIERLHAIPCVDLKSDLPDDPGLTYRYRSPKAGGHAIITGQGEVYAINFDTRTEAERAIANAYDTTIFQPPAGHEPREPYVSKNAKIYQPRAT